MQNELNLDVREWVIRLAQQTNKSAQVSLVYHYHGITVIMSAFVFDRLFKIEHVFSEAGVMACKCSDAAKTVLVSMMLNLLQEIKKCEMTSNL